MITSAKLNYIRITPRKFRLIIPLIKGKNPEVAIQILMSTKKNAAFHAIQLLKSALANAKRIQGLDTANLYISRLVANCGPTLKRYRAASMGRAGMIRKRTSHIVLELDEIKTSKAKPKEGALHKTAHAEKKKVAKPAQK